jgi:hypothetical protein
MTNPARLSGPRHLDSFILTQNSRPSIGSLQKRMPTLTLTATQLNRRAVTVNTGHTTNDKISQKNYHPLHYMYRLFDFLYKRILPLYIKPRFLYITRVI